MKKWNSTLRARCAFFLKSLAVVITCLLLPQVAQSTNIPANTPICTTICATCPAVSSCVINPISAASFDASTSISVSLGDLSQQVITSATQSANGPTINLSLNYNSWYADPIDTVMGYGWTHSYNNFLFSQVGSMFRFDGAGGVTRYKLGRGGTYTAAAGYFETLVKNSDGSFTLTQKDKTTFTYASIPGTPFLVAGPVWRLTKIVDRNGNTTTLTYTAGNLTSVTDTYGRATTFTYNSQQKLASITDPDGRVTTLQYDSTAHQLLKVTDPNGNSIQYSYNYLYQLIGKIDKAGRTFSYSYSNGEPVAVLDSNGTTRVTLSNPTNWATDPQQLAINELRVYIPSTTSNTDGRGNVWKYQCDANGYITQIIAPDATATMYTYDPVTLHIATMTDANGHTTSYTYDSMGNMLTMTDALLHITTYTYESTFNMMTSMTDPRGRKTAYTIDPANGNRTQETDPLGQTRKWTYDSHGNVLTYTDKDGNITQYVYDAFGNVMQKTEALGTGVQSTTNYIHDAVGNLTSVTDALGRVTKYQYDGMDRLILETDVVGTPQQRTIQTFYDGEGNRTEVIDGRGIITMYQYDLRNRLITETDAVGTLQQRTTTTTYDANDNRTSVTDALGRITAYQYDTRNRLTMETDATGTSVQATTQTAYDAVSNISSQTDANGHTTSYTYDPLNRRSTMTDAAGDKRQYFYDTGAFTGTVTLGGVTENCLQCGATPGSILITERVDPDGTANLHAGVTFFKYDALNRLIITDRKTGCFGGPTGTGCPDTQTSSDALTLYTYDPVGNRKTWTEPDGNTTTYQYDQKNRLMQEANAAGDVTSATYDLVNNVATVTAPNLNVTNNSYDALNRLMKVADIIGLAATYTYDADDNRASQGDGDGNISVYAYDFLNRMTTATDPLGKSTTYRYDAVNNLLSILDRNDNTTSYTYDALNRRVTMTDALGYLTTYIYDLVGNLIQLIDGNLHATQYAYDAVNRPIKEIYPDKVSSRSFTYDPVGNLLMRTDPIGQTTTYAYSDLYFRISRAYPFSGTDTFTYDPSGRLLSAQHGSWPDTFSYDGANRLIQTVQNGHTIGYVYNIPGRTRQITYPGGRVITEHTDFRGRMDHINDAAYPASIVQYTYDAANNVLSRNYRNGTTSTFTYNANNWTTNMAYNNPAIFAQFGYAYDNEGNKQYENKTPQDPTHSEGYQYDSTYRLINYQVGTLVGSTITVPTTQTSYSLDPVGNWNSKTTNGVPQTRVHNADNELIQINSTSLTYDANGNTLNDGTYIYAHDEENRLIDVTRIAGSVVVGEYQYDALSRRVGKTADSAGTASTTVYFYDGPHLIEEQNSLGVTSATYVYGNYVNEVLTMDLGGNTYYYHQDALWSVEAMTDSTATPVERYSYDAYGLATITNGTGTPVPQNAWGTPHSAIGNPWMFTGQRLDEETGLYFYRARYYDPAKGRFLQRDPLESILESIPTKNTPVASTNLFEYVRGRPTRFTDPFGLNPGTGRCYELRDAYDPLIAKECDEKKKEALKKEAIKVFIDCVNQELDTNYDENDYDLARADAGRRMTGGPIASALGATGEIVNLAVAPAGAEAESGIAKAGSAVAEGGFELAKAGVEHNVAEDDGSEHVFAAVVILALAVLVNCRLLTRRLRTRRRMAV